MEDVLGYSAMATGIVAAVMISANFSRRMTGYAFVLFTFSSVIWIAVGYLQGEPPILIQNAILTFVNLFGVYRWLILKKPG